eukprot:TRINITY_DN971_c0_g1_i1.p1 TRINITY_DN971_c0_g1~~TRINITY_DN971_c0_g1_i1.p1  ORF type:complete len:974 (+),score=372.77 TRINITY_DN971_c0_g1_i1:168-3089(+)
MAKPGNQDWLRLQRKIFSRWVNQKVFPTRNIKVDDIVEAGADGSVFVALIEVLSEKQCPYKLVKDPKNRVQVVENANNALKFVWDSKVELKIKPQGNNLADKDERSILALTWAIMLKFLKFGDDTEALNAKEALLLWVKNKIAGYEGIKADSFGKDFHDGLVLAAIIHKHRPKLINWESLSKDRPIDNLKVVFDAAEKYFQLEKYLVPEDIPKLDEASMVVYVSEYYYGIAEQRKMDLAARRIGKVIKLTEENDAMRAEYTQKSQQLREHLNKVEKLLEDRTVDNTVAGAKRRLEEFYLYKANDKNQIIQSQLTLEGIYNNLAMRLSHNKRPPFQPGPGLSLQDINAALAHLEECEQERKVALHKELNRQIRLQQLDEQHKSRYAKLNVWFSEKSAYLNTKQHVESVSSAELQLRLLEAYQQELATIKSRNVVQLTDLSNELNAEKYEHIGAVKERDAAVSESLATLDREYNARKPVADDDLTREKFKEVVRGKAEQHARKLAGINAWIAEKEAYLLTKEEVNTVADANRHLSYLALYEEDKERTTNTVVADLKALGKETLAMHYKTQYSEWRLDDYLTPLEQEVDAKWVHLSELSAQKKAVLTDDLNRELEKERLRLEWAHRATDYVSWVKDVLDNVIGFAQFGFTLEEVEAYAATLAKSDEDINNESQRKIQLYTETQNSLTSYNVTDNVYSSITLADLSKEQQNLANGLAQRKALYDKELARQRANDALCKKFAELADPLSKFITEQKDKIAKSQATLEEQLNFVQSAIDNLGSHGASLQAINATYQQIEEAGITNNKYTILTAKDVEVQWEQYTIFLNKKKAMLEEEIQNEKLRGITPEQLKEIEQNFQQFDKDNSGVFDAKKLKAVLYSLGEEKGASEIEQILKTHGQGTTINYEGFKDFMIHLYGDADTKEEIQAGFKLINRGQDVATDERIELVMSEHDVAYFKSTAPKVDGGYSYNAWIDDVYSR